MRWKFLLIWSLFVPLACQKGPVMVNGIMVPVELQEAAGASHTPYTRLLAAATRSDSTALASLLQWEVETDSTVALQHGKVLLSLLQNTGDEFFAKVLEAQSESVKRKCWAMLDQALSTSNGQALDKLAPMTWGILTNSRELTTFTGLYHGEKELGTLLECSPGQRLLRTVDASGALDRNYRRLLRQPYAGQNIVAELKGVVLPYYGNLPLPDGFDAFLLVKEVVKLEAKTWRNTCIPYELWAIGNEPYWQAQVSRREGVIEFTELGMDNTLYFPYKPPQTTDTLSQYAAVNQRTGDNIEIFVRPGPCGDAMSERQYPYRVSVRVNGRQYNGCGLSHPALDSLSRVLPTSIEK
ncbi:MAG: hypothetical protein KatS3mg029_0438 [Saprospiraceae bacterium]|nr:MAG: hypothetical protein KatS3mg029_0438 [Saprospiraceae bacterium]